jgi:hypothetical protein
MDQFTINLLFVGASFALYIGIAIWARAGSTSEFYAAGRGVQPGHQRNGHGGRLDVRGLVHFNGGPHRLRGLRQLDPF